MSVTFDGVDDRILSAATLPVTRQLTVFVRGKPTGSGQNNAAELFEHGGGLVGAGNPYSFAVNHANANKLQFGSRTSTSQTPYTLSSAATWATNVWHSWAAAYDGTLTTNLAALYWNGVPVAATLVGATSGAPYVLPSSQTVYWGNTAGGDRTFNGRLFEQAWWDRVLAAEEVRRVHLQGPLFVCRGLQHWWRASLLPSATQADLSGNGRTGTRTGAVLHADNPPLVIAP